MTESIDTNYSAATQAKIPGTTNDKNADGDPQMLPAELSREEQQEVAELKRRDAEVRRHEQAHLSAAGSLAKGGAHFEYETGPDNKRYAVEGHVRIDSSKVPGNPQASISKAKKIHRAALAPQDPSGTDRQVAAKARQMEMEAQQELHEQKKDELLQTYDQSGKSREIDINASTIAIFI